MSLIELAPAPDPPTEQACWRAGSEVGAPVRRRALTLYHGTGFRFVIGMKFVLWVATGVAVIAPTHGRLRRCGVCYVVEAWLRTFLGRKR